MWCIHCKNLNLFAIKIAKRGAQMSHISQKLGQKVKFQFLVVIPFFGTIHMNLSRDQTESCLSSYLKQKLCPKVNIKINSIASPYTKIQTLRQKAYKSCKNLIFI